MKTVHSRQGWCSLALVLAVLLHAALGGVPVLAASGPASAATPSNATPAIGEQITVAINIDMSGVAAPNDKLGSFTGSLDWNPAVLSYHSNSGIAAGFTGLVNTGDTATGHIVFNGASAAGAAGNTIILTITFDVVGGGISPLDLAYRSMAAAGTFQSLLPTLTVTDGQVVVGAPPRHYVYLAWVGRRR